LIAVSLVKKKLAITALVALPLLAGAATVRWWLTPSLRWLGVNSELLQGLDALIQVVLVVGGGIALYFKLWRSEKLTAKKVHQACRTITQRRAEITIDGRNVIARPDFQQEFNEFLSSESRYCFAKGESGVGKTIAMATEATRLLERGWTVLLVRGRSFSVESAIEELAHELHVAPNTLSWSSIAELWMSGSKASLGFALMIDPLDLTDVEAVDRELELLHDAIGAVAPERLKVVASCRDSAWVRFHNLSSFNLYKPIGQAGRKSGSRYLELPVADFSNHELDRALETIGAIELITPGRHGASVNAHIATLRGMLRHPATFEHYADLWSSADESLLQNLTWSSFLGKRLEKLLALVRKQSQTSLDLEDQLIRLAMLGQRENSNDFLVDVELIKKELPSLFVRDSVATLSPYDALIDNGLLIESVGPDGAKVGFRMSDAGAYFLSFDLETQAADQSIDELDQTAGSWLETASTFQPLLDALLAWIDRLAENPLDERLLALLRAMVRQFHFRHSSLFSLMNPRVMESMFVLAERADDDGYHDYWEAAREVRSSPEALAEIRRRLDDSEPRIRRLAAELSGRHRDAEAAFDLISLLDDGDQNVSHNAYVALGKVGRAAGERLLQIADDTAQPATLRSRCLNALRGVGFRDARVSEVIEHCLRDGLRGDDELLRSSLLAAAHLRVEGQTEIALKGLPSRQERVALSAAKYLTEVPDVAAFETLKGLLRPQLTAEGGFLERYSLPQQMMAALVSIDRGRAEPIVLARIRDGLSGMGEMGPVEAIWAAERIDINHGRSVVLENFLSQLQSTSIRNELWRSGELLAGTWLPDQLLSLVATAAKSLSRDGNDLARLLVDAIAPNMRVHDEFPLGDRLNRVKDLLTGAKCEASNFAPEAGRLLADASELSAAELCKLLWIAGDDRAEDAIIRKLEAPVSTARAAWYERNSLVRALGTCGNRAGAKAVISYVRSEKEISIYFDEQTLYPLLRRKVISADEIVELARDRKVPAGGRIACLLALADLDAPAHKNVFLAVANDNDELIQGYAVRMLGGTKDSSVVPFLRNLLRSSTSLAIRAQSAESLARLDARQTLAEIERAAAQRNAGSFVGALTRFAEASSLPIVLDGLAKKSPDERHEFLTAIGSFWKYPDGRQAVLEEFAKWTTAGQDWFDNQSSLIVGMVNHEPNECLKQFNALYDEGHVNPRARETMASRIPQLFGGGLVDRQLLKETIKRLVCDRHVPARERSVNALGMIDVEFCGLIYEELNRPAASERDRACATYMLGFWNSDPAQIRKARFDGELLVRRAADAARDMQRLRTAMTWHVQRVSSDHGLARLCSYLCLKEQGQLSSIWELNDASRQPSLSYTFAHELTAAINERLKNDYRKKEDEEKKLEDLRGTVWFN
jgi:HEAT repeat protein